MNLFTSARSLDEVSAETATALETSYHPTFVGWIYRPSMLGWTNYSHSDRASMLVRARVLVLP